MVVAVPEGHVVCPDCKGTGHAPWPKMSDMLRKFDSVARLEKSADYTRRCITCVDAYGRVRGFVPSK